MLMHRSSRIVQYGKKGQKVNARVVLQEFGSPIHFPVLLDFLSCDPNAWTGPPVNATSVRA